MHGLVKPWAVLSIISGLLMAVASGANAVGWSDRAPMQEPRQEVAVAELDGQVYVIGGFRQDASVADTVEAYDPVSDTWTFIAPFPVPIHHAAAINANGKLYVVGGCTDPFVPLPTLFEYDAIGNSWIQRASMPAPRCSMAAAVVNGKIYVAGGSPPIREQEFTAYDPVLNEWSVLSDMPTGRNHLAAGARGGNFYAIGGRSGGIEGVLSVVEEYDPDTGLWATKTPMPTARGGVASATLGQYILVFGGEGNPQLPIGVFEAVEAYDVDNDTWLVMPPMPTARHGIGAAVIGSSVHVPGGADNQGLGVSARHEIFEASGISDFMGVFCDVRVDKETYGVGDEVVAAKIRVANLLNEPVKVELKSWLGSPSGETSVLNLGSTGLLMLPPGIDFDLAPLSLLSVTNETVAGKYEYGCRTLNQVTGKESTLHFDKFDIVVQ